MDKIVLLADQGASTGMKFVKPFQELLAKIGTFTIEQLIPFLLVLIIGGLLIRLFMKLLKTILNKSKLDKGMEKIGLTKELQNIGIKTSISGIIIVVVDVALKVVLWMTAIDLLKIDQLSAFMARIVNFLPNIIVSIIILGLGLAIAKFAENTLKVATDEMKDKKSAKLMVKIAKISIIVITIMTVLDQLNIAQTLVNTLLTGIIGSISIALGLSFGLGGKEKAAETLKKWFK